MRDALKKLLESTMQVEKIGQIRAKPHEPIKTRTDYRNGSNHRNLTTRIGFLRMLGIPRSRKGGIKTEVIQSYQRRWKQIKDYIRGIIIAGDSTREIG